MDGPAEFSAERPPSLEDPSIKRPMSHGWRPGYLRRRVIAAFNLVFIISIITLETLNARSRQQKGLTSSTQSSLYLWTLGPTTVITVVLVFWSRVEYQASRYMPWIILARPIGKEIAPDLRVHDGHRTIFLDYPNMSSPNAIWTAFKNKHWLVLVGILSSMIIRVQIVLSSGLFSIELIPFQLDLPVSLIDHISDKLPNQQQEVFVDYRPYRTDQAILDVGLPYPNFTSPGLVLQQFDIQKALNTAANITAFTVVVDGLSPAFTCDLPLAMITVSNNQLHYDVKSASLHHSWNSSFNITDYARSNGYFIIYGWEDSSEDNPIIPYFLALVISSAWENNTNTTRYEGSATMCEMQWLITPTSVTYKNGAISTHPVQGATSRAITGPLLDFLSKTQIPFIQGVPQYIPGGVKPSGEDILFVPEGYNTWDDLLVPFAVGARLLPSNETGLGYLMTPAVLEKAMEQYHLQHDVLAVHLNLRDPIQRVVNGTASRTLARLVVHTPICQALVGLFGLLIVLTLPMLWHTAPRDGFLPREPTTLGGLAAILSKSRFLMSALAHHGHLDMPSISADLKGAYHATVIHRPANPLFPEFQIRKVDEDTLLLDCDSLLQDTDEPDAAQPDLSWYRPWILHPLIRGTASVVLLGMIVTLGVLYGVSNRSSGIGTAPNGGLLHYSWTLVPSALFIIANLYMGSCDFEIRNLASFVALRSELSSFSGILTSFADQIGIRTLFNAIKARCSVVVGSKSTVLLGALLPIFTSNLFSAETIQLSRRVTFQQNEWIASSNSGYDTSNLAAGTILAINLSYPAWTFEDLVFPRVSLANGDTLGADAVVTADIRAVRTVLACKASIGTSNFEFSLNGTQYTCPGSKTPICAADSQLFGIVLSDLPLTCSDDTGRTGVSMFTGMPITAYAWGSCAEFGLFQPTNYTAVLLCDESFEEVEVTTTLFGPDLEIRDSHPPKPKDSTAEPYMLQVNDTSYYEFAAGATANRSGDLGFFPALATGRYNAPEAWFRNDTHREDVIAAIKKQHGILRAQGISGGVGARRRFDNAAENLTFVEMSAPRRPPNVDGEYQYVSRRVIQHPVSSFILLGLLTTVLLLHVFTTVQSEREGYRRVVPKPPGSIAAVASLFADSDIPQHLPIDAQWMTDRKLKAHFQGRRFRMGWFEKRDGISRKKVYTIREISDANADSSLC